MTNLHIGAPDGHQSSDDSVLSSRFRPRYRALTAEENTLCDAIKDKAQEMEALFGTVKSGRYNALAMTSLEQSVMWIIKELTS